MASLPLYTQNEIYNLVPGEVNWKNGDTVQILPTFPYDFGFGYPRYIPLAWPENVQNLVWKGYKGGRVIK